jgi:hypothetical protein
MIPSKYFDCWRNFIPQAMSIAHAFDFIASERNNVTKDRRSLEKLSAALLLFYNLELS